MKNLLIFLGVVGGIILLFVMYMNNVYNTAVKYDEETKARWSDVGASYQRRADLIPGLIATVKGAAANEKDILGSVTALRSGISAAQTPEDFDEIAKKINTAINITMEAYPQIRSTENFQTFQAQLEGTENRITHERMAFNEAALAFNARRESFPTVIIAGFFGDKFKDKAYFKSQAGAERAPEVKF